MDTVIALTASRSPGQLVSVGLDSGERFLLSTRRLAELRLAAGDELDSRRVRELREAAEDERNEQRVLRLIAVRPRSRTELAHRLAEWQVREPRAQALLERLESAGLLDERQLAADVSEGLRRRGHGSLRAAHDLDRLAVDPATAAPVVGDHAATDAARARALLVSRFGHGPYAAAAARRAAALLARRGFGAEVVSEVLGLDDHLL
ncbi:MAG TPA: RecX family transcriptional regulator [Gaiellales bacterium]